MNIPSTWRILFPTLFPKVTVVPGPKHSTTVSSRRRAAVPLSVDEKDIAFTLPNPLPGIAVNVLLGPHILPLAVL